VSLPAPGAEKFAMINKTGEENIQGAVAHEAGRFRLFFTAPCAVLVLKNDPVFFAAD